MKRATFETDILLKENCDFNPRPREEGDIRYRSNSGTKFIISIHALVKRATVNIVKMTDTITISIHALVKRATFFKGNFF